MTRPDVVLLSTAEWGNPFWTNKQHVACELARRGHRVFYIDSLGLRRPSASRSDLLRIFRRLARGMKAPRKVRDGILVWSPLVLPLHGNPVVGRLNRLWLERMLALWLRRFGFRRDWFWTYNPLTTRFLRSGRFGRVVYHCVDEIAAQPGMPAELITRHERELCSRADVVFVTAPKLLESRARWSRRACFMPNVADFDHFARARSDAVEVPEDLARLPKPRIGFIGAISGYKLDFELIAEVARVRPEWSFVLIGKVGEGDPWTDVSVLRALENVHLVGPRAYADLPACLKGMDVAILPNRLNEYTAHMFPMKFFEYLAAGKPVVSVPLPALQDFSQVATCAADAADFVRGIEAALAGRGPTRDERLAVARQYTYRARTGRMLALIEKLPPRGATAKREGAP